MDSISSQARSKLSQFEGSDFSTTAWAFSALGLTHEPLLDAISAEVIKKIGSLGAQQLGTLVDLGLPCQKAVEQKLQDTISRFLNGIPKTVEEFKSGVYSRLVEDFEVDNFGTQGDRYLLAELGIQDAPPEFGVKGARLAVEYQQEHAESWWRSEGLLHQRVVSYAEIDLELGIGRPPIRGCRYQQNGYHGTRQTENFIIPTSLPFNHNVDRSLCSENQLLSSVCEDVAGQGARPHSLQREADSVLLAQARGWVRLFVTGAPCLSCVGAMRQFQLLLPNVSLCVSIGEELQHDALSPAAE